MVRYQGEDISFQLKITNNDINFQQFQNVAVYFYTDCCFISKFDTKTLNYNSLKVVDSKTLSGIIPSNDTKKMNGIVSFDIMFKNTSIVIKRKNTNLIIKKDLIKMEV